MLNLNNISKLERCVRSVYYCWISNKINKNCKKWGFKFVGSTVIYFFVENWGN